jgi:hypothetical protein
MGRLVVGAQQRYTNGKTPGGCPTRGPLGLRPQGYGRSLRSRSAGVPSTTLLHCEFMQESFVVVFDHITRLTDHHWKGEVKSLCTELVEPSVPAEHHVRFVARVNSFITAICIYLVASKSRLIFRCWNQFVCET